MADAALKPVQSIISMKKTPHLLKTYLKEIIFEHMSI